MSLRPGPHDRLREEMPRINAEFIDQRPRRPSRPAVIFQNNF